MPRSRSESVARMPMDVLYDVANLGLAFGTELTRTGIFRATESYVRAVLRQAEVRARFAALESYVGDPMLAARVWATGEMDLDILAKPGNAVLELVCELDAEEFCFSNCKLAELTSRAR